MSPLEWSIVVIVNVAIIAIGVWKSRETTSSVDWFLAARGLPWWMVGLSMFATAVDSGDYVAVAGQAYKQGMPYISAWWIGLTVGWMAVAWIVFVPMYRSGMYTNCEYLEHRFGPTARIIAAFIQVQSRTNVMANVAFSLFLTFNLLTGWGDATWWLVVAIALAAAAYTASGGLKSVALTDTLQSIVMMLAALILWWSVWSSVEGWSGLQDRLESHVQSGAMDAATAESMTHVGARSTASPFVVIFGYIVVMGSYCVINQSQAMRMLASRSKWDLRMAAVVAAAVTAIVMWFNVTLGILGRAVFPELETVDEVFLALVQEYLLPLQAGLVGLVVAGLLAGGISTYDSIGSALSSVLTRDVYARFLRKDASDTHYLRVSQAITFVVIGVSFVYIPFLKGGMVAFYLKLVGVAVVPLFTVYLVGVTTRAAYQSGTPGLLFGIGVGLTRFIPDMPDWWTNTWWGYVWSIGATAGTMGLVTLWKGRVASAGALRPRPTDDSASTWLESSQLAVPDVPDHPFESDDALRSWYRRPSVWTVIVVTVVGGLNVVVFW